MTHPTPPATGRGVADAGGDAAAQALSLRLFSGMLATQESFIAYLGVKHIDMMLRPEKLWRIIQAGRGGQGGQA